MEASQDPDGYLCLITHEIMWDPVVTSAGMSYSRDGITRWLEKHDKDPITGEVISRVLYPNVALRRIIRGYMMQTKTHMVRVREYVYGRGVWPYMEPGRVFDLFPWEVSEDNRKLLDPARPDDKHVIWLRGEYDAGSFYRGLRFSSEKTDKYILSSHPSGSKRVQIFVRDDTGRRIALGIYREGISSTYQAETYYTGLIRKCKATVKFPEITGSTFLATFRLDDDGAWIPSEDTKEWRAGDIIAIELFQSRP